MSNAQQAYDELIRLNKEAAVLYSVDSLLGWDERTQMPRTGTAGRAEMGSLVARLQHEKFTSPRIGELLGTVESSDMLKDPICDAAVNVRDIRREYDRARKLPASLVEEMSRTRSLAEDVWIDARKNSDFKSFQPWLEKTLKLKQQAAECYGYKDHIYDALVEDYEPGATTREIKAVFDSLRPKLAELIKRVVDSPKKAPVGILQRKYPLEAQQKICRGAASVIGFDFNAGRLDVSVHPFCAGIGPGDTRMTTRYREDDLTGALFGVMHESGHGMYDQGLDAKHWGTPRGSYISLGIHESQSRMWENLVGRSRAFWKFFMPSMRGAFADTLKDVSDDDFVFAANSIQPSLIRTESDEATYNLHIMLRFEMEQRMLAGELAPKDVPGAWNERMKKDLGVTVPDDAHGCLQDTHWASGLLGYFPTYALGNLYAAQFFEQARKELGDLDAMFARGEFKPLLSWLQEKIHRPGRTYTAPQLVKKITGSDLSPDPLMRHLSKKAKEFYGV
ncbi:MAG: carboxypeptidase M32 [Tepidisphaeraceae bacterium]